MKVRDTLQDAFQGEILSGEQEKAVQAEGY